MNTAIKEACKFVIEHGIKEFMDIEKEIAKAAVNPKLAETSCCGHGELVGGEVKLD